MVIKNKKHNEWLEFVYEPSLQSHYIIVALLGSFTAPLLWHISKRGFLLHFVGRSSTGKTTLSKVACSVWGNPRQELRSWYLDAVELENVISQNDNKSVAIDNSAEIDSIKKMRKLFYTAYFSTTRTQPRGFEEFIPKHINTVLISNGENTLKSIEYFDSSLDDNVKSRIVDIEISPTCNVITDPIGKRSTALESDILNKLSENTEKYYGEVGNLFTEYIKNNIEQIQEDYKNFLAGGGCLKKKDVLDKQLISYTEKQRKLFNIFNDMYFTALQLIKGGILPESTEDYLLQSIHYCFFNNKENL